MKCETCNKEYKHFQSISTIEETRRYYKCPSCNNVMIQHLKVTSPGCAELVRIEVRKPRYKSVQSNLDSYL